MSTGCLKLDIPKNIFSDCGLMKMGQKMLLTGSCQKNGGVNSEEEVQVLAERKQDHFTFCFYAESMGSVFQTKLDETWQCRIQSVQKEHPKEVNITGDQNNSMVCDPAAILAAAVQVAMEIKQKAETAAIIADDKGDLSSAEKGKIVTGNTVIASKSRLQINRVSNEKKLKSDLESGTEIVAIESEHESEIDNDLEEALAVADLDMEVSLLSTSSDEDGDDVSIEQDGGDDESSEQMETSKESPKPKPNSMPIDDTDCYICGRAWFPSYISFKRHITDCQKRKKAGQNVLQTHPFCCEVCKTRFKTKRSLQIHRRDIHDLDDMGRKAPKVPPPDAQYCTFCGDYFDKNVNLDLHQRFHCPQNPKATKPHYCPKCTDVFPSLGELQAHKDSIHRQLMSSPKPFGKRVCPTCGLLFSSKSGLYMHTYHYHMGESAFKHPCSVCGKKFVTIGKLQRHFTRHDDSRDFTCDKCGKTFKHQSHLHSHVSHVHENRYPYRCQLCGHGVAKKKYLESHICGRVRRVQEQVNNE